MLKRIEKPGIPNTSSVSAYVRGNLAEIQPASTATPLRKMNTARSRCSFALTLTRPLSRVPFCSVRSVFSNDCLPLLRSKDGRKGGRRAFSNRW